MSQELVTSRLCTDNYLTYGPEAPIGCSFDTANVFKYNADVCFNDVVLCIVIFVGVCVDHRRVCVYEITFT